MIEKVTKYCPECGSEINRKAEICPECGVRQPGIRGYSSPGGEVNRVAAALLALFLGGIGAHKFYLGRPIQGLIYIIFVWTGIPALIGLIEGLIYLYQSDAEFHRQYT